MTHPILFQRFINILKNLRGMRIKVGNSTYNKLAVQCLNEVLCFVSSSVLADSLELRNRHLLVAKNDILLHTLYYSINKLV